MYSIGIIDQAETQLVSLAKQNHVAKIKSMLGEIVDDPYKRAKKTELPIIGEFYVNAGSYYAVVFDINSDEKQIRILQVIPQAKLYRVLKEVRH